MANKDILNQLDDAAFLALSSLEKAQHTGANLMEYFDCRDNPDEKLVITGFKGAALDHDIIQDYVSQAFQQVQTIVDLVKVLHG